MLVSFEFFFLRSINFYQFPQRISPSRQRVSNEREAIVDGIRTATVSNYLLSESLQLSTPRKLHPPPVVAPIRRIDIHPPPPRRNSCPSEVQSRGGNLVRTFQCRSSPCSLFSPHYSSFESNWNVSMSREYPRLLARAARKTRCVPTSGRRLGNPGQGKFRASTTRWRKRGCSPTPSHTPSQSAEKQPSRIVSVCAKTGDVGGCRRPRNSPPSLPSSSSSSFSSSSPDTSFVAFRGRGQLQGWIKAGRGPLPP